MAKRRIPGVSFSWKRALGLTQAKQSVSRQTGVPLTRSGWERKIGSFILNLFKKKK